MEEKKREDQKKGFHIVLYNEVGYILAMFILASAVNMSILAGWGTPLGTSLFYVLNQWIPALSIGQWNWVMQAIWLVLLVAIVWQMHLRYLVSLVSGIVYGLALDVMRLVFSPIVLHTLTERIIYFSVGFLLLGVGLQIILRCGIPTVVYDLIVKEVYETRHIKIGVVKTVLDVSTLVLTGGIGLLIFGRLVGLGIGTVIIAFFTGAYVQLLNPLAEKILVFKPLIFGRKIHLEEPSSEAEAAPEEGPCGGEDCPTNP